MKLQKIEHNLYVHMIVWNWQNYAVSRCLHWNRQCCRVWVHY